jgi:group I intron endonuclease
MQNNISLESQNKSGIYMIRNNINHKIYIGSAVNLRKRYNGHSSTLILNKSENGRLQNFVNKYGIDKLSFNLIEIVENKEKLIEREQFYLDLFKSYNREIGFNISPTAGNILGVKMPQSHKDATSKRMRGTTMMLGKKHNAETIEKCRLISKQRWIDDYDKMYQGCLKSGAKRKGKPQWINGKVHPMLGKPSKSKGKKMSPEFCEKISERMKANNPAKNKVIVIAQIDINNNIIQKFNSISEASSKLNLCNGAISRVLKGEYKHTKGYRFNPL